MSKDEIVIRKTPFLFLKWLVIIEFFFALFPIFAVLVSSLRESYDASAYSQTISYNLLIAIVVATLQVLIVAISFVAWYFPVYHVDRQRILHRRSNLFEDKELVATQAITQIDLRQGGIGRRLDYGTLVINSTGTSQKAFVKDVPNPANYARLIQDMREPEQMPQALSESRPVREVIADGENQYAEFKSSLMWDYRQQRVNKNLYEPVMKNIVAFLNSTGGTLLIGVDDEGVVLGLGPDYQSIRKPNADGFENVFNMAFNKMIGVEFRRFVDVTFPEIDGKEVCVISVRPSSEPAYLTHKGTETFYIRAGNATQPLSISKATRYMRERFGP